MITTVDLLTAYSNKIGCKSKNQLAKKLGVSSATVSQYYSGLSIGTDRALEIAEILKWDLAEVLVGNICEKSSTSQRVKIILCGLVGHDIRAKPDRLSYFLSSLKEIAQ